MKHFITILLLILVGGVGGSLLVAALTKRKSEPSPLTTRVRVGDGIYKHSIEGHDYLIYSNGGIIHSESCTNHISTGLH